MNILRKLGANYIWGVINWTLGCAAGGIVVAIILTRSGHWH